MGRAGVWVLLLEGCTQFQGSCPTARPGLGADQGQPACARPQVTMSLAFSGRQGTAGLAGVARGPAWWLQGPPLPAGGR